jgi:glycerol-3-phosphate dehydrogenase
LIGTTDNKIDNISSSISPTDKEINFLLNEINNNYFNSDYNNHKYIQNIKRSDIKSSWSGIIIYFFKQKE